MPQNESFWGSRALERAVLAACRFQSGWVCSRQVPPLRPEVQYLQSYNNQERRSPPVWQLLQRLLLTRPAVAILECMLLTVCFILLNCISRSGPSIVTET